MIKDMIRRTFSDRAEFNLHKRGYSLKTEISGGVANFLAISYIVIVNPLILSAAGLPISSLTTSSVCVIIVGSLLCSIIAGSPFVIATGMGVNTLFATLVTGATTNISMYDLFGSLFYAGFIFAFIVLANRKWNFLNAIPTSLRIGFGAGIGLLIVMLALSNVHFLEAIEKGGYSLTQTFTPELCTFFVALAITFFLVFRNFSGSFLWAILLSTLIAFPLGRYWGDNILVQATSYYAAPDFGLFGALNLNVIMFMERWPLILLLAGTMFFDCYASTASVAEAGNMIDKKGKIPFLHKNLFSAAVTGVFAGVAGTSSPAIFIESATGVRAGARTGIASFIVAMLAIPFLFFAPTLEFIPSLSLAPTLIVAGAFMLKPLLYVRWERLDEVFPVLLCMFVIPFTRSTMFGMSCGIVSWTFCKVIAGKYKEVPLVMYVLSAIAILLLVFYNNGISGNI